MARRRTGSCTVCSRNWRSPRAGGERTRASTTPSTSQLPSNSGGADVTAMRIASQPLHGHSTDGRSNAIWMRSPLTPGSQRIGPTNSPVTPMPLSSVALSVIGSAPT
jgi:hypothetical protein